MLPGVCIQHTPDFHHFPFFRNKYTLTASAAPWAKSSAMEWGKMIVRRSTDVFCLCFFRYDKNFN